jgi:hypothetical protein
LFEVVLLEVDSVFIRPQLISQRHYVLVALTERGHALKSAFRLRQHSDRAVAINRVSVIGEVPAAAFAGRALRDMRIHRRLHWRNPVRAVKRNRQQQCGK